MSQPNSETYSGLEAVLLGAGNRGYGVYGAWALEHPDRLRFVAVADPDPLRRERFAREHGIPPERCFSSWQDLLEQPQFAPALVNALPDPLHEESAVRALERGYHQLLEKPLAHTLEGGIRIARAAQESGKVLMLGYVLRFAPFFRTLKRILESGDLGQIVTVMWRENVASTHFAHSYVRGNWGNQSRSSPFVLAKSSHDLDLLGWLLGTRVKVASSFGNLLHFRAEQAPKGAPQRCLDGCPAENTCPYHVKHIYLSSNIGWPTGVISTDLSLKGRMKALEYGPYGRCVYHADNDVVDHQVASLLFENGVTATFTVHGHSAEEGRTLRMDGTRATLYGTFSASRQHLRLEPHNIRYPAEEIALDIAPGMSGAGHGGGDAGLCAAFVNAVQKEQIQPLEDYLESQILAFALEEARLSERVVDLAEFRSRVGV